MLIVHHLRISQSERVVWLCEELGLTYELKCYDRDPVTRLAPPEYKALHPMGAAPVIDDGTLRLAESGAVVDYLVATRDGARLTLAPTDAAFATYLYWLHFANGNLQPAMGRNMILSRLALPADNPVALATKARLACSLEMMDAHVVGSTWLAGSAFTIADIMTVFSLTTMRNFYPLVITPYGGITGYLRRIGERDGYRRAMAKGDPGMHPMLD